MPASTRDTIIETAASLFLQRGYSGTGLKLLCTESNATIGSLYHFFPGGKEELAAETLRFSGRVYQTLVEGVFDAAPDIVSSVRAVFDGAAATLEATDYADACPVATVALEVASSDERLRVVSAEIFDAWLESARSRLRAAGVQRAAADRLAKLFVAALEGGFLLSRVARSGEPLRAIGEVVAQAVEAEVRR